MTFKSAFEKLTKINQLHLLKYFEELSPGKKEELLNDIDLIDVNTFLLQQRLLKESYENKGEITPFQQVDYSGNEACRKVGEALIDEGKVGVIVIAGGQGTRLSFQGPKGCFPVSNIKQKTLFQLFAEKVVAASKKAKKLLPIAIMTSPLNDLETKQHFIKNNFFGLKEEQLFFFSQKMLPFLNDEGNLFLEDKGKVAFGPDGNGYTLKYFVESCIYDEWKNNGIQYVTSILVDNPLAEPFDGELVGFHSKNLLDLTLKCTLKQTLNEKVGVLVDFNGKPKVIEYSEFPDNDELRKNCPVANLSLFSFSMSFIEKCALKKIPLHKAHKAVSLFQEKPTQPNAWKFETFIFDILSFADRVKALVYPREECFSPLKNAIGENSLKTVQDALQNKDKVTFKKITGKNPPTFPFELSQDFYYPSDEFLKKIQEQKEFLHSYID